MNTWTDEIINYEYACDWPIPTSNFVFQAKWPLLHGKFEKHEEFKQLFFDHILEKLRKDLASGTGSRNTLIEDGETKTDNIFTQNYYNFNVFLLSDDPLMKEFQEFSKEGLTKFLELLNAPGPDKLDYGAQCWMNEIRQLDSIGRHRHQGFMVPKHSRISVSSNYCLDVPVDYPTYGIYYNPFSKERPNNLYLEMLMDDEYLMFKNVTGDITFFPSCIDHQTTTVKSDFKRYTIAADYMPYLDIQNQVLEKNRHIVKL